MNDYKICTALTHLITPYRDKFADDPAPPSYYCCINAGVPKDHLDYLPPCPDRCACHEMPEGWRPGDNEEQTHVRHD
jgi:hypothetical protein